MKKPTKRLLIGKLDRAFSELVRKVGKCERCGRTDRQLNTSHIYSRSNKAVRWDRDNAFCLCVNCHINWWHKQPIEAVAWLQTMKTDKELKDLQKRANSIKKWTIPELQSLLEDLRKEL